MPRLTGTVVAGAAAEGAYVQIQNLAGDFQAEIRTDAAGRFLLHPIRGRWRLVCWLPGDGRAEREVEVGAEDLDVEVGLA
jgi:hypothetical protein